MTEYVVLTTCTLNTIHAIDIYRTFQILEQGDFSIVFVVPIDQLMLNVRCTVSGTVVPLFYNLLF